MKSYENHLFIIWNKALPQTDLVLQEIEKSFEVQSVIDVDRWDEYKTYFENLKRFYQVKDIYIRLKINHCWVGPFKVIIIKDTLKKYERRKSTGWVISYVNSWVFDIKATLRSMIWWHTIHSTNSDEEFNENLSLLFNEELIQQIKAWKEIRTNYSEEFVWSDWWKDIQQLFSVLDMNTNYLVMRNFYNLSKWEYYWQHNDIDVLTDDLDKIIRLTNAKKVYNKKNRVHYSVEINNKLVYFDFRYIWDKYYCESLQKEMLATKIRYDFFYIPQKTLYFQTLAYHALIHKPTYSLDYQKQLLSINSEYKLWYEEDSIVDSSKLYNLVTNYLYSNWHHFTIPIDESVHINSKYVSLKKYSMRRYKDSLLKVIKLISKKLKWEKKGTH